MAKAAKTKTTTEAAVPEVETVYVPGTAPRNLAELEANFREPRGDYVSTRVDEAVVVQLNPGTKLLLVRWVPGWHHPELGEHRRKQATWMPVMRLDTTPVSSREVVFCRPWLAGLTPELMALAENEFGRSHNLQAYLERGKRSGKTATKVEVDAVAHMHSPRICLLWVKHRGLWAPAGRWQSGAVIDVWQPAAPYPEEAVV